MRLLANVTDAELVRAAVFFSPNKWSVHFGMNATQFNGKFASPLSEQLLAALLGRPQAASPGVSPQAHIPPYAAPTVANIPVSQQYYLSAVLQPGQFQQFATTNNAPLSSVSNKRSMVQWYKTRTRRMKITLGCGALIAVLLFFSCIGSAFGSSNLASTPTPTPTPTAGQAAVVMSPAATQQPSPRSLPTQQPTQQPTRDPLSRYERSAKNGNKQSPPAGGAPYIPIAEVSSFTGRLNKNHIDDTQSCGGNYA